MAQQTLSFHLGHHGLFLAGKGQQQNNQPTMTRLAISLLGY